MKKLLIAVYFIFLSLPSFATNYTVKAAGGGNFTTMTACASQMSTNGTGVSDTCTVFVGTYNESVTIPAGSVGNYKIFNVNGSDVVTTKSFTLRSHTKLIGNCTAPATVGSCGFNITNPSSPNSASCVNWTTSITDFYITNNVMNQCGGNGFQVGSSFTILSSFGFIQGNTLSYACVNSSNINHGECNSIMPFGDHFLIENNDLSHYTLSINFGTDFSVYRNNTFHDQFETEASGNFHTDAFFSEPGAGVSYTVKFNVFERNLQYNAVGANSKTDLFQSDNSGATCPNCFNVIFRYNTISRIGSGVASNYYWPHIMAYNNTVVDSLSDGTANNGTADYAQFSTNGSYLNQLYYFSFASGTNFNVYQCGSGCNFGHSLYWCTGSCSQVWGNVPAVPFLNDPGNKNANPLFVNYISPGNPSNDYHLQAGSPAIAAGTFLTSVVSGCNTSALTLGDASYFQDGYGIAGVQADWIRVGTSTTGQISSINYTTNVVTMTGSVSCTNGNSVYLYKDSSGTVVLGAGNPDIGAFPVNTATVATPTFSPVAGTYASTQTVTISTTTSGATLCYTIDGSTPTANGAGTCTHGTTYSGTVSVSVSETIKAVGSKSGLADSSVGTAVYVIRVGASTPTFSPVAGTYGSAQSVTISTTSPSSIICYNTSGAPATDGNTGCTTGTLYSGPITVSSTQTLFAVAGGAIYNDSSVGSAAYTITVGNAGQVVMNGSVVITGNVVAK